MSLVIMSLAYLSGESLLIDQNIGILNARDESLTQKLQWLNQKLQNTKGETSKLNLSMQIQNSQEILLGY